MAASSLTLGPTLPHFHHPIQTPSTPTVDLLCPRPRPRPRPLWQKDECQTTCLLELVFFCTLAEICQPPWTHGGQPSSLSGVDDVESTGNIRVVKAMSGQRAIGRGRCSPLQPHLCKVKHRVWSGFFFYEDGLRVRFSFFSFFFCPRRQ